MQHMNGSAPNQMSELVAGILCIFAVLAAAAVFTSVVILRRGWLYHSLKPDARPRRWVLFSMLTVFGIFLVWFPVWFQWPQAWISRVLTLLFGATFFVVGMSLKWFSGLVDWLVKRAGRPLR